MVIAAYSDYKATRRIRRAVNGKELDNAFMDVRNAFRLLARYQSRVQGIVNYIREHTPYTYMWGNRRYCDTIHSRIDCPDEGLLYNDQEQGLDYIHTPCKR